MLDNAIKYSPAGSRVSLRVEQSRGEALLAIEDEGPGIAPEHRERVFHRFFRVDEARSRDRGGAGLGLAIAKWAVEVHGGTDCGQRKGRRRFRIPNRAAVRCRPSERLAFRRQHRSRVGGYVMKRFFTVCGGSFNACDRNDVLGAGCPD